MQLSKSTFINSGRQKKVCYQLQLQGFAEEVKVNAGLKINYSRDQEIVCLKSSKSQVTASLTQLERLKCPEYVTYKVKQ